MQAEIPFYSDNLTTLGDIFNKDTNLEIIRNFLQSN
jgi:hypothetical protein